VINAFICEQSVPLDVDSATQLPVRLREWDASAVNGDEQLLSLRRASLHMAARLDDLLPSITNMPPIPALVTGISISTLPPLSHVKHFIQLIRGIV
jgi:hypothetical protein